MSLTSTYFTVNFEYILSFNEIFFPIVIVTTMEFPINVKVSLTFIPGDHSAIVIERFIKLD